MGFFGDTLYILRLRCNNETLQRKHDWSSLLSVWPAYTVRLWFCWTNTALSAGDEVVLIMILCQNCIDRDTNLLMFSVWRGEKDQRPRGGTALRGKDFLNLSSPDHKYNDWHGDYGDDDDDGDGEDWSWTPPWENIRDFKFLGRWGVSKSSW